MVNSTEKKDHVWVDIGKQWEEQRLKGGPVLMHPRTSMQLRNKFDCLLRDARKHSLMLARANGTHGGSGNGREEVENLVAPPYFQQLLDKGFLNGPMANKQYVLGGQRGVASLGVGSNSGEEEDGADAHADESDNDAGWCGEDMPPTTEPIGGRGEAHRRAEGRLSGSRNSKGSAGEVAEPNGRKRKASQIESAFKQSAETTAGAAMQSTSLLVECIDNGNIKMAEIWEKDSAAQDRRIERICTTLYNGFESLASAIRDSK
mmetsp:Transcript_4833/g.13450  ORF Transcript_4833/g.13450 Transcript_4833/m.13450 type:complete len:261 (-) Transcript_4833:6-788(-)